MARGRFPLPLSCLLPYPSVHVSTWPITALTLKRSFSPPVAHEKGLGNTSQHFTPSLPQVLHGESKEMVALGFGVQGVSGVGGEYRGSPQHQDGHNHSAVQVIPPLMHFPLLSY